MKKPTLIAFFIFLSILAYFGLRAVLRSDAGPADIAIGAQTVVETNTKKEADRLRVLTRELVAESHPIYLSLKGRTAPNRVVTVRAGTTGTVVSAPDLEGKPVAENALLCRLDVEARQARILEAEALLLAQQQEFSAADQLVQKDLAPINRLNMAKANLDAAQASLNAAKIELSRTEIRAPFSGIFETRLAERGDFLSPGGACGVLADLDPILIEAEITEDYALTLKPGAPVDISILGAEPLEGQLSYIARTSSQATRTFKIEARLENRNGNISAGLTSELKIKIADGLATPLTPGLLTLHDDGRLGVRHVTEEGRVVFSAVNVVDDSGNGIWVTGLPERVNVVSLGQEYIVEEARVIAVPETGLTQ